MPDELEENEPKSSSPSNRVPVVVKEEGLLSRYGAPAALVIAVVAVALAIWALMGGTGGGSSSTAGGIKLTGDPKTRVCKAFDTVSNAVSLQTHSDLGTDPVAASAVAANSRLALLGGGQYLADRIGSDTPSNLAGPMSDFASDLEEIGMYALAGAPNTDPDQAARLTQGDLVRKQIVDLCK